MDEVEDEAVPLKEGESGDGEVGEKGLADWWVAPRVRE